MKPFHLMAQVQSSPTNWICNIWYLLFQNCLDLILNESFIFLFRSFSKLMVRKDLYKFYLFEEKHDVIFVDSRLENSNDWQLKKLFTFKKLASNCSSSQKLSFKGGFAWRLRLSYVYFLTWAPPKLEGWFFAVQWQSFDNHATCLNADCKRSVSSK